MISIGDNKFIFIHIHKTAGNSVCDALKDIIYPKIEFGRRYGQYYKKWRIVNKCKLHTHHTIKDLYNKKIIDKNTQKEYYKFTVIRNPWDRIVTSYIAGRQYNINLDDTIKGNLTYREYIEDLNGNLNIDFVLRFENLQNDFNTLCDNLGIERRNLRHLARIPREFPNYSKYLNEKYRDMIAEKFKEEIGMFGYKFEEDNISPDYTDGKVTTLKKELDEKNKLERGNKGERRRIRHANRLGRR